MSCFNCGQNPCRCPGSCPENEPLASMMLNFQNNIVGAVVSVCVNGVWDWTLPCELDDGAVDFPRLDGESVLCYFMRYLEFLQSIVPTTFPLPVAQGGTGADNASDALANLGAQPAGDYQPACANLDDWCAKAAPSGEVVGDTDAQVITNKEFTNPDNTNQTLADGATVNWNMNNGGVAQLTIGGNRTMAAPTNLKVGTYVLKLIQDGTGSRLLTWNGLFKWVGGTAPVLSTVAGKVDIITFFCDGSNLYGAALIGVS